MCEAVKQQSKREWSKEANRMFTKHSQLCCAKKKREICPQLPTEDSRLGWGRGSMILQDCTVLGNLVKGIKSKTGFVVNPFQAPNKVFTSQK